MRKSWIVVAAIILSIGNSISCKAEEAAAQSESTCQQTMESLWHWQEDADGWKYVEDNGIYKKHCWDKINGYWYYFDYEGYMVTDWKKIKGINYCFGEKGDLKLGWCYNEEDEKWYYFKQDGTVTKGWYHAFDGSWYWFSPRGKMTDSGYRKINGKRYYFFDNGQLAANQYVGLSYMDENGWRNKKFDIVIHGKQKASSVSSEIKDEFTQAFKNIPREWIKKFNDQGWQILYYPDKDFFSAPMTGAGLYFVCHKVDTHYKKIKICDPNDIPAAIGEYIGYAAGCYQEDNEEVLNIFNYINSVEEFVYIPDYYADDKMFYFGRLVETYLGSDSTRKEMEESVPEVTEQLKEILYSQ